MENEKFSISNYMRKGVTTVGKKVTFREAVQTMIQHQTNGLAVVDSSGKICGILSILDLIEYIVPDYLEYDKHLASFEAPDVFEQRVKEVADIQVGEFMTKHVHVLKGGHSMIEALTLMSEHHIRQIPIVDNNDCPIGYITRTEVKKAIGDALEMQQ